MTKINNTGIISKKIVTDELVNSQGDKYLTDADLGGVSGSLGDILNAAVQEATEAAINAQTLAEVAAVDSLKYKSESVKAQLLAEAAAINALVTKQETYDNQMLAETAAINALVYLEEARAILEEIKGLQQS